MRPYKTIRQIGILILTAIILIFSTSCRKNNKDAQLHTDTERVVIKKGQTESGFNIINMGNNPLSFTIESSFELINVNTTSGELGFNQSKQINISLTDPSNLPFGILSGNITIKSNVGNKTIAVEIINPAPLPAKLSWNYDFIKITSHQDSTEIEIKNIGENTLNYQLETTDNFLSFSPLQDTLQANETKKIVVTADKSQLNDGLHTAHFRILSNGGNATITTEIEKNIYSISFYNPTFTPITINSQNDTTAHFVIEPNKYHSFIFSSNPGSFAYYAKTKGKSLEHDIIGLNLIWKDTLEVSQLSSPIFDLDISADFFFMQVRNNGIHSLDKWSVNNGTTQQIDDNVNIPNDGNMYNFGYYDALDKTKIFARLVGTNDDAYWANGTHFNFPNTINQSVLLESELKSSATQQRIANKKVTHSIKANIYQANSDKSRHFSYGSLLSKKR